MRYSFVFNIIFYRIFYQTLRLSIGKFFRKIIRQYNKIQSLPEHLSHLAWREDLTIDDPSRLYISKIASIGQDVIFATPSDLAPDDPAKIIIADNVFLGTGVELGLASGSILSIGRNTSMHRGTVILGNVKIGCNCIFSYNIFIASGNHVIDAKPTWLIKDQDDYFLANQPLETVLIEDDVWLGWGVFIKSGVYIGRGAIIGANSVVTHDVEPYSICAGAPARLLQRRLTFTPHHKIQADRDDDLPYFYAGFKDDQVSLSNSRRTGVIWAEHQSRSMLQCNNPIALKISGCIKEEIRESVKVSISLNNQLLTEFEVMAGAFEKEFKLTHQNIPPHTGPQFFSGFIELEITYSSAPSFALGISQIELMPA